MHSSHDSQSRGGGSAAGPFLAGVAVALAAAGFYLFGPDGSAHRRHTDRMLRRARREIHSRARGAAKYAESAYDRAVDEVLSAYERAENLTAEQAAELKARIKERWHSLDDEARADGVSGDDGEEEDDDEDEDADRRR